MKKERPISARLVLAVVAIVIVCGALIGIALLTPPLDPDAMAIVVGVLVGYALILFRKEIA